MLVCGERARTGPVNTGSTRSGTIKHVKKRREALAVVMNSQDGN